MKKRSAMCIVLLAAVLFLSMIIQASAADTVNPIRSEDVDAIVTGMMEERHIPGLSVAISLPGEKAVEKSYGLANVEYKIPVQNNSIFQIGSITKTFTAIAILLLEQEGKLSVHDRLTKYFPQCQGWRDITLKHLLQHTSGIRNLTATEPFKSTQGKDWTPQEVIAIIAKEPLDFETGQKAAYSNTGSIILGLVIEKVTGISYGEFLSERIAKPLGMNNTALGSNRGLIPGRVSGYTFRGELSNAEYASVLLPYASGGIMSTPSDLIKMAKVFKGEALLSKKSVSEMCAPTLLNNGTLYVSPGPGLHITFGYGLDSLVIDKKVIPAKTGGISGFNSFFVYFPESRVMVALTANLDGSLEALIIIVNKLAEKYPWITGKK
jgi:D-alanyl-D-alanine carboxypeptidase